MSTNILFFLIIPLAVIVFSIALEKLLNSPLLVASIAGVVMLILAFAIPALTTQFLISSIVAGILAFITSILYCLILNAWRRNCNRRNNASNNTSNTNRSCCRRQ